LPQPHLPIELLWSRPTAPAEDARPLQPDALPPELLALPPRLAALPPELAALLPSRRKPCRKRSRGGLERLEWLKKCAQTPQPHDSAATINSLRCYT
jgi:hypothetical protein